MSDPQVPERPPEVTRCRVYQRRLRRSTRELAEARAQIGQLEAKREEERSKRLGPGATKVLAGCIVVARLYILD